MATAPTPPESGIPLPKSPAVLQNPKVVEGPKPLPFVQTASKMQTLGWVLVAISLIIAGLTIWGAIQFSQSSYYQTADIVALSIGGGGLSITLLGFGIYLIRKDYWNDASYVDGQRLMSLGVLRTQGREAYSRRVNELKRRGAPELVGESTVQQVIEEEFLSARGNLGAMSSFLVRYASDPHVSSRRLGQELAPLLARGDITQFFDQGGYVACLDGDPRTLDWMMQEHQGQLNAVNQQYEALKANLQRSRDEADRELGRAEDMARQRKLERQMVASLARGALNSLDGGTGLGRAASSGVAVWSLMDLMAEDPDLRRVEGHTRAARAAAQKEFTASAARLNRSWRQFCAQHPQMETGMEDENEPGSAVASVDDLRR